MSYENQSEGSKSLDQREHNGDASAKRVVLRGQNSVDGEWYNIGAVDNGDGTFSLPTSSTATIKKTLIDKTTTTDVIYIGEAAIGTATSSSAWFITKVDKTASPISITYASAGASTATWNNRATTEVYT